MTNSEIVSNILSCVEKEGNYTITYNPGSISDDSEYTFVPFIIEEFENWTFVIQILRKETNEDIVVSIHGNMKDNIKGYFNTQNSTIQRTTVFDKESDIDLRKLLPAFFVSLNCIKNSGIFHDWIFGKMDFEDNTYSTQEGIIKYTIKRLWKKLWTRKSSQN